ncbi:hypothetical protein WG66_003609 [Moniliophthora roreri]|nr:hypothetical protein WG66_003609 [Moniliophthora roreri]
MDADSTTLSGTGAVSVVDEREATALPFSLPLARPNEANHELFATGELGVASVGWPRDNEESGGGELDNVSVVMVAGWDVVSSSLSGVASSFASSTISSSLLLRLLRNPDGIRLLLPVLLDALLNACFDWNSLESNCGSAITSETLLWALLPLDNESALQAGLEVRLDPSPVEYVDVERVERREADRRLADCGNGIRAVSVSCLDFDDGDGDDKELVLIDDDDEQTGKDKR